MDVACFSKDGTKIQKKWKLASQLHLFCCVVAFDGFGLDDAAGVAFLPVLAGGGHRARHVAAREGYCGDYRRKSYHDELFHTADVF